MSIEPDGTPDEGQEQELSLSGLSKAFAEALARENEEDVSDESPSALASTSENSSSETEVPGDVPGSRPEDRIDEEAEDGEPCDAEQDDDDAEDEEDAACPISPRTILEAVLFMGDPENRPLETARAAELMRGVEPDDVPAIVDELNDSYRRGGCPYRIRGIGAGYRLVLEDEYHQVRDKFHGRIREARLSQAAIDILAIVAYRQPIAADEVNRLRDKPCHNILAQLVRRRLLCVERPPEKPRKTVYRTTDRFLELFELESLADLPESAELDRA